jgi:hypothetical protein
MNKPACAGATPTANSKVKHIAVRGSNDEFGGSGKVITKD